MRVRGRSICNADFSIFLLVGILSIPWAVVKHWPQFRRHIYSLAAVRFKFDEAVFKSLTSLPIMSGFEDRVTFKRPATRTGYAAGMKWENNQTPTGTRGRGPTDTRESPPPASRPTGLRETRHREPTRIRSTPSVVLVA